MKNYIYIIVILCSVLSSCNKDIVEDTCSNNSTDIVQESLLLNDISNFNDSLLSSNQVTKTYNRQQIMEGMAIVVSDAIGAYRIGKIGAKVGTFFGHPAIGASIGALIGGAYSSYNCYNALNSTRAEINNNQLEPIEVAAAYVPALEQESLIDENLPKQIILDYSTDNEEYIETGAKHNIIVKNLQLNNFVIDSDIEKLLSVEEVEILTSEEFIQGYDSVVCSLKECIIKGEIPQDTDNDVSSLLMNHFFEILETYSDKANDVEFIINKYIDAVEKTNELTTDEKENIYRALSVAASSYEFWNEN